VLTIGLPGREHMFGKNFLKKVLDFSAKVWYYIYCQGERNKAHEEMEVLKKNKKIEKTS